MRAGGACAVLVIGAALFFQQSWVIASQDLDFRPVALADFRKTPLDEPEARLLLEAGLARGEGRADICLRLGELLDAGTPAGAPADDRIGVLYRKAAHGFPAWGLGQYRLAMVLLREGLEPEGRHHIAMAASCAGNHPALLFHLGEWHLRVWSRTSDPAALLDSVSFLRRAVARDGDLLLPALRILRVAVARPGDLDSIAPGDPESRVVLALFHFEQGADEAGMAVLDSLGGSIPPGRRREVLRARGGSLLRAGRMEEAFACFRSAFEGEEDVEALARALEGDLRRSSPKDQVAFWASVTEPGPRVRLAHARALVAAGETEAGLQRVDHLLEELEAGGGGSENPDIRRIMVECHAVRMRDWIQRKVFLQAAVEAVAIARLDGRSASWVAAARLHAAAGREDLAKESWQAALDRIGPGEEALEVAIRLEMAEGPQRGRGKGGK